MDNDIYVSCRHPGQDPDHDINEIIFKHFIVSSFGSNIVYIVSPWISNFRFSKPILYYPYLSTGRTSIIDIISKILENGTKVRIVTRCIDDLIKLDLINLLEIYNNINLIQKIPDNIIDYLIKELENAYFRIKTWISFKNTLSRYKNFELRVDLDSNIRSYDYFRLHSKIYVNDRMAILGSANFTRSGIVSGGNWECIMLILADAKNIYDLILDNAKKYFNNAKNIKECELRVKNLLKSINVKITGIDDFLNRLERILNIRKIHLSKT